MNQLWIKFHVQHVEQCARRKMKIHSYIPTKKTFIFKWKFMHIFFSANIEFFSSFSSHFIFNHSQSFSKKKNKTKLKLTWILNSSDLSVCICIELSFFSFAFHFNVNILSKSSARIHISVWQTTMGDYQVAAANEKLSVAVVSGGLGVFAHRRTAILNFRLFCLSLDFIYCTRSDARQEYKMHPSKSMRNVQWSKKCEILCTQKMHAVCTCTIFTTTTTTFSFVFLQISILFCTYMFMSFEHISAIASENDTIGE